MRVVVAFGDERLELDVPEGRLVAAWDGPPGVAPGEVAGRVADALREPADFPSVRQAVVPGDRVAVALGAGVPDPGAVIGAVCEALRPAGVEPETVTVVVEPGGPDGPPAGLPEGVTWHRHDPDDRAGLAYLASTAEGRRVYLNRLLTDADFVLPVGVLAYDPVLGYEGPWGVVFPGLSDAETRQAFRSEASAGATDEPPDPDRKRPALVESAEVSWLLGSQLQLGLVPGVSGVAEVVAGLGSSLVDLGSRAVDARWSVRADARAELVVVGVGRPGAPSGFAELSRGLETASRLVRRGGKVVVLSRASGEPGGAVARLVDADGPREALAALRGAEAEADFADARRIARALAWADVYVYSGLPRDVVEDLAMIPLDRPEEARRLVAQSPSSLVVSQADRVRASVVGEGEAEAD